MISLWTSEWNYRAGTKCLSLISRANGQVLWIRHTLICDKKAQGQSRRTSGEVIHLKVIFRETGERRRERGGIQPYHHCWMDERWNKQTETSIKTKWKNLISLLTDWISIAPVCCLVTSHCPAHFQMLIRWETINKSMAAGCWPDCFRGEREVGPLVCREVDLNRTQTPQHGFQGRRFRFTSARALTSQ